jgi:hypothetical protein
LYRWLYLAERRFVMAKWQEYHGGTMNSRWTAANEWLKVARSEDAEFELIGFYMFTPLEPPVPRLIIEFTSDIVRPEQFEL